MYSDDSHTYDNPYHDVAQENTEASARANERENDEDDEPSNPEREDLNLSAAIRDVSGNAEVLAASLQSALTRDQISQLINRLSKKIENE